MAQGHSCHRSALPVTAEQHSPYSRGPHDSMEPVYRGLGRCACCFWLAVAFDVLGLLVLLLGVFVNVFFYDLLIYAGAIIIFLSLVWWVFWYSGNIEVPPAELQDDVGLLQKKKLSALGALGGAVRRLSSRVSGGARSSLRKSGRAHSSRAQQVSVTMATVAPREDTEHAGVSTEVQMPATETQSSPARRHKVS